MIPLDNNSAGPRITDTDTLSRLEVKFNPKHWADLQKSGLSEETIRKAGLRSIQAAEIPGLLGFNLPGIESALVFPYSQNGFFRLKVFPPYVDQEGHKIKYLQRKRSGVHLYLPPSIEGMIRDQAVDLYITEGEKKALRAVQEGLCCIGLGGVWSWKQGGDPEPVDEIKNLALSGRRVFLVPDSDFREKENVRAAVYCLGIALEKLGAQVRIIPLPAGEEKP